MRDDALACRQPWKPWGRRERGREGDGRAVVVVGVKGDKAGVSEPCAARGSYICSHSDAEVPLLQSPTANLNQLSTTVPLTFSFPLILGPARSHSAIDIT